MKNVMSAGEARHCISAIRNHRDGIRDLLLELEERNGWNTLGYANFTKCIKAEFPQSVNMLYSEVAAGKIEREIFPDGVIERYPERTLRPLRKLKTPDERRKAWQHAQQIVKTRVYKGRSKSWEGKVTATIVSEAVDSILARTQGKNRSTVSGEPIKRVAVQVQATTHAVLRAKLNLWNETHYSRPMDLETFMLRLVQGDKSVIQWITDFPENNRDAGNEQGRDYYTLQDKRGLIGLPTYSTDDNDWSDEEDPFADELQVA